MEKCLFCNRPLVECECERVPRDKPNPKAWPTGTWFQERLKKIRAAAFNGDAGRGEVETLCLVLLIVGGAYGLYLLLGVHAQVIKAWLDINRCLTDLLHCTL